MPQIPNPLRGAETRQDRAARWGQTIAADVRSRKPFRLENERMQTRERAKRCTARSGWAAAHDRHVEDFHLRSTSDQ